MPTQTAHAADTTTDPRPLFAAAVQIAEPIIAGVQHDHLDLPTPCARFDVKALLDHLVYVVHHVADLGRDEQADSGEPRGTGAWAADWRAGASDVEAAWSDDARLEHPVVLPWTTMTGAEMLATYAAEITTHTWDLATATGQYPAWDDGVCRLALDAMHRELPMADRTPMWESFLAEAGPDFQFDAPFANAVAVSSNAPLIDQLVAWSGRQP